MRTTIIAAAVSAGIAVVFLLPFVPPGYPGGAYVSLSGWGSPYWLYIPWAYAYQGTFGLCVIDSYFLNSPNTPNLSCFPLVTFAPKFVTYDYAAIAVLVIAAVMVTWRRSFLRSNMTFAGLFTSASIVTAAWLTFSFPIPILGVLAIPTIPWFVRKKQYLFAALPIASFAGLPILEGLGGSFMGAIFGTILQNAAGWFMIFLSIVAFAISVVVLLFRVKNIATLAAPKTASRSSSGAGSTLEEEEKRQ